MTDLHTHILPGMDDGARTVEESLELLRMERGQGVDTVVLTPHFYRDQENPKHFLKRREAAALNLGRAIGGLSQEERKALPALRLGAEVAWWPNLADCEELSELCIGNSKHMLLELPFVPWNDRMLDQLYDFFGRTGITPVIAHLERYLKIQKPEYIRDVQTLGVPIQISGDILLRPMARGGALKLLKQRGDFLLASDCHNCTTRKPNLEPALAVLRKKLGGDRVEAMLRFGDELVLE